MSTTARFIRPALTIRRDIDAAEKRLDELRKDPSILASGSQADSEYRWVSLRLSRLRSELSDSTVRPTAAGRRY